LPGVIYPGESFLLHSIPDGVYDLLIYADDGSFWEDYGISLYGGQQRTFNLLASKSAAADNAVEESSASASADPQLEQPFNAELPVDPKGFVAPESK